MSDVLNWLVSARISNYVTFRFDDVIYHFTLSADDVTHEQDPKSQRTSHILKLDKSSDTKLMTLILK